jgi:outer membrane protein
MKKIACVLLFALTLPLAAMAQDGDAVTIATININKVLVESEIGKAASKRINDFGNSEQAKLQEEVNKFRADYAQLQSQKSVLSSDAYATKENELQKRELELQQKEKDLRRQLTEMNKEELQKFSRAVEPIVTALGKERGYTLILDSSPSSANQILYLNDAIDITAEVIQRLDAATASASNSGN